MLFGGPRLDIKLAGSDLVWLYPVVPGDIATFDAVIEGTIVLKLPSAQRITSLTIALVGTERLLDGPKREHLRIEPQVKVGCEDVKLNAGEHLWPFALIIPPDTAPSEKCEQGRIDYKLVATLSDGGLLGSSVKAERHVLLQTSHAQERLGLAPSFSMEREVFHERFGPMRIELISRFCLVAGYLRVYFYLPDIPTFTKLELWQVELVQTVKVENKAHETKFSLWRSDEDPTAKALVFNGLVPIQDGDGPWLFSSRQMRLPSDNQISSTTHAFTDTPLQISHHFVVRIIYFQFDGPGSDTLQENGMPGGTRSKQMVEFFSGPATISSCSSRIELSQLPTYEESTKEKHRSAATAYMAKDCLCRQMTVEGDAMELKYGITREQVKQAFEAGEQQRAWAFREIRQKTEARAAEYAFIRRPD